MREKIIAATLLLASLTFAQNETDNNSYFNSNESSTYTVNTYTTNPAPVNNEKKNPYYHAHRGFYFSTNLTFGYTYVRYNDRDVYSYERVKIDEYKYTGFMTPYEEVRIGGSIANVVSLYGTIGLGLGTGTLKTRFIDVAGDYYDEVSERNREYDATNIKFTFGGGLEVYPIQDLENPMYGLFLGIAGGMVIDGAFYDKYDYYDHDEYSEGQGFFNLYCKFEVGKDFWFSRRWSFGFAFNYTLGSFSVDNSQYYNDYKDKESFATHTFGLSIRITH